LGGGQGGAFTLPLILKNSDFFVFLPNKILYFSYFAPPRKSVNIWLYVPGPMRKNKLPKIYIQYQYKDGGQKGSEHFDCLQLSHL